MRSDSDPGIGEACLAEARQRLGWCHDKIRHFVGQLDDAQVWWRPRESMNSIGNLMLHLCGNLTQRFLSVVAGLPDSRDRPLEFSERGPIPRAELLGRLDNTVTRAGTVLDSLTPAHLLERRRYRGLDREFDEPVVVVILQTLAHATGHTQEIILMTRWQMGDAYKFQEGSR